MNVDFDDTTLKLSNKELWIGQKTWQSIFSNGVKAFHNMVATTVIKKFTFNNIDVDYVIFLLPDNQDSITTYSAR